MKFIQFQNGDRLPALGLGTWKSKPNEVYNAVKEAIRIGYRHIDCAFIYGNEAEIGKALSECLAEGLVKREDLWITSKLWNNAHGIADVRPGLKNTLADLQLDYLDLYLIHWPVVVRPGLSIPQTGQDLISLKEVPLAETWQGMEDCLKQGLCRHIGVSNFSIKKLRSLLETANVQPEMNQIELHPHLQQKEMLSFCQDNNIFVTAYSPLGSGDRPDSFKGENEPILLENPVILKIAKDRNCTPAQVLLSWALQRGTIAIPKSVNPKRLQENLAAAEITLTDADMSEIAQLDRHYRYVSGSIWAKEGSPYTLSNLWDE